jgi:hypothetical protein
MTKMNEDEWRDGLSPTNAQHVAKLKNEIAYAPKQNCRWVSVEEELRRCEKVAAQKEYDGFISSPFESA